MVRPGATYSYYHVFIDTDESTATGYPIGGIGADYMIENSSLYDHTGTSGSWSWTSLGSANHEVTGNVHRWKILRSSVGETGSNEQSKLVFHGGNGSTGAEHTSPVYTHDYS